MIDKIAIYAKGLIQQVFYLLVYILVALFIFDIIDVAKLKLFSASKVEQSKL